MLILKYMLIKFSLFVFVFFVLLFTTPRANAQTCPALPTNTGSVTFNTTIQNAGTYKIWSRIKPSATDVNANSYWFQNGTQCGVKIGDNALAIPANTWTWVDFQNGDTTQKALVSFTSGSNVIKIIGNEANVQIDKMLIVTSNETCIPTGTGDNCTAVATATPTSIPPTATPIPTALTPTLTPTRTPTPTLLPTSTPVPTNTPVPNSTKFNLTVLLHGIGNGGDNANPTSKGNFQPLHPQRNLTLELYDANNTLVKSVSGSVAFNSTSGNFAGILDGGSTLSTGSYLVKVKGIPYLRKQIGGIITVTNGATVTLPQASLTTGDANNDNQLNILDYNLMLDCYSELELARDCTPAKLLITDFNDDGSVNQFDYNLFLRELSIQSGQ